MAALATLNGIEVNALAVHEKTIKRGLSTFVEVGRALMAIRDGRLYRATHARFADYCNDTWGIERRRAYLLIDAAEATDNVIHGSHKPQNERQARELAKAPKEQQAAVWEQVIEDAPKDDAGEPVITAAHVAEVVEQCTADPEDEPAIVTLPIEARVVSNLSELAGEKYGCIYADPPWQYGNQATRAATDNHYATMTIDRLCEMPVADLAADDAHLHLWTTNAFLFDAKRVMEAWGFEYRSVFVWVKPQMGIGNYWRVSHEFLLLGIRGNAKRFKNRSLMSWQSFDRGKHSSKPEEVRGYIECASPGPYLELFGRKAVECWTVMGNQVEEKLFA